MTKEDLWEKARQAGFLTPEEAEKAVDATLRYVEKVIGPGYLPGIRVSRTIPLVDLGKRKDPEEGGPTRPGRRRSR